MLANQPRAWLSLGAVAILAAAAATTAAGEAEIELRENVVYGQAGDVELTLHLARPVDAEKLPGLLFLHRGGFVSGSKDRYLKTIVEFARHGYVVASVGYRFAPKHPFPAQIEDCKCAVRWMRAHAEELGVDPERIGAIGESAGGYLSMMLGTLDADDGMEGEGGWADQPSKVQAVVSFYGPTDLRWERAAEAPEGFRRDIARRLLSAYIGGAKPEKNAELLYRASPLKYVDAGDAPMMLIQGTDDPLVRATQASLMIEALTEAGVEGRAEFIFGKRHDWDGDDFEKPLVRARAFLDEQLKAPPSPRRPGAKKWNPQLAADYLDSRAQEWIDWRKTARSQDSSCVSCHTTLPYLLARDRLGTRLDDGSQAAPAKKLFDDIRRRVKAWDEAKPWYGFSPEKAEQSRGTEAVINAFLLTASDTAAPPYWIRKDTKTALANLWATQRADGPGKGSWAWLDFDLEPWESEHAEYWGAAMAAVALSRTPEKIRGGTPEQHEALREYLRRGLDDGSASLHNQAMLLLAARRLDGLLDRAEQNKIADALMAAQRPDGGWALGDLGNWSIPNEQSDAYATGLCALVLNQFLEAHYLGPAKHGARWLTANQDGETGAWPANSVNVERDAKTMPGQFMQDAATAFAVLALTEIEW